MRNTSDLINSMQAIWDKLEAGTIAGQEARTFVAIARTMLDAKKVEALFAHLNASSVAPVQLSGPPPRALAARKAA